MRSYISMVIIVLIVGGILTGCAPIAGFVNGEFLGDDYKNTLHKMEIIARNAAIVYDPDITDDDFDEWVAEHRYEQRRFTALLDLYIMLVPEDSLESTEGIELMMNDAEADLNAVVAGRE